MPSNRSRHPSRDRSRRDPFRSLPSADRQEPAGGGPLSRVMLSALFALPFSLLCGLVLLSVMAGLALTQSDPNALTTPLSLAVLGLSAVAGGLICSRRCGESPLLCGLIFGLLLVLLMWGASLFFSDGSLSMGLSLPVSLLLRGAVVALSCVGARMGAPRPHAPAHRRIG